MPVILATQKSGIRRIAVQSQPRQIVFMRPCLIKTLHKKGLVEWLKVKALSSNPSTAKKIFKNNVDGLTIFDFRLYQSHSNEIIIILT
jgi:hypothetical protein